MSECIAPSPEPETALLLALGERLRLARKRRGKTAAEVAAQAAITRVTLRRIECGEPTVMMGTYLKVMRVLGLAQDLVLIARDDTYGRQLQDAQLLRRAKAPPTRTRVHHGADAPPVTDAATASTTIRLADYPVLRDIAWNTDPTATLSADEAFALYERHWRHIDQAAVDDDERHLIERLTASVGNGVLLV